MQHSFWQTRWDEDRIGFHSNQVNPRLQRHAHRLGEPSTRVLVPLCGKSLDLEFLATQRFDVLGVEFVEKAARQYFEERDQQPTRETPGGKLKLAAHDVTLWVADFFSLSSEHLGVIDAIYDRAALVAVEPQQRAAYVEQLVRLARGKDTADVPGAVQSAALPKPRLLLINFVHDMPGGPPFSIPDSELSQLFEGRFNMTKLEDEDVLARESSWRQRGATYLKEQVWWGTLA